MARWILTDASTGQHVIKSSDKLDTFHFVDTIILSSERYAVISDTVLLKPMVIMTCILIVLPSCFFIPTGIHHLKPCAKNTAKMPSALQLNVSLKRLHIRARESMKDRLRTAKIILPATLGRMRQNELPAL